MGLISYTESPVYKSTNDAHSSPAGHSEKYAGRSSRGRAAELDGLTVSMSTVADLHRVARGEIDTDEVIRNIHRRLQNVPLLRR